MNEFIHFLKVSTLGIKNQLANQAEKQSKARPVNSLLLPNTQERLYKEARMDSCKNFEQEIQDLASALYPYLDTENIEKIAPLPGYDKAYTDGIKTFDICFSFTEDNTLDWSKTERLTDEQKGGYYADLPSYSDQRN